jgi:predicted O-methyltransferase YrrM
MTSRHTTRLLSLSDTGDSNDFPDAPSAWPMRLAFGALNAPWLAYSLWGGTKASKRRLLARLDLADDALPHLGSWKADTGFLHRIVDAVEQLRPRTVVELGAGASSLVCARALAKHGGGRLFSYDQHADFVAATARWLREEGQDADLRHAPLRPSPAGWPGLWYDLQGVPDQIDLIIIDGPPWAIHPFVRGAAETLFDRLSPGGVILLDDAARPGERVVASRWRKRWPDIRFERLPGGTKGTLIGRKVREAEILPFPSRPRASTGTAGWRRAAAVMALIGSGWIAHDVTGGLTAPAHATAFVDEASASHDASLMRQRMQSQVETTRLDRAEILRTTGLRLPDLPARWQLTDVQVYPSELGVAVALVMRTDRAETVSLFATRAETPAEALPTLAMHQQRAVAYWEAGPFAYALTGDAPSARMMTLAAEVAG